MRVLPLLVGLSAGALLKAVPLVSQHLVVTRNWLWPLAFSGPLVLLGVAVWTVSRPPYAERLAPSIRANVVALGAFCVAGSSLSAALVGAPVWLCQVLVAISSATCIVIAVWPGAVRPEGLPSRAASPNVRFAAGLGFWFLAPGVFAVSLCATSSLGRIVLGINPPRAAHPGVAAVSVLLSLGLVIWLWRGVRRQWPWVAA